MRLKYYAFLLLAGLITAVPNLSYAQFPGMGGGGGGFGGGMNADFLFNMLSKGKESVSREELDERGQRMFDRFAPMMGLTGNTITRDQFRDGMTKVAEMAKNGQLPGIGAMGKGAANGGPGGGGPGAGGPGGAGGADRLVEEAFKRYDKNQDGVIQIDELPEDHALRNERAKYDTNSDGVYDLNEFRAYVTARFAGGMGGMQPPSAPGGVEAASASKEEDPDKRPNIYRANNLPKDLPAWFAELDRNGDRDGQVGLYEWKESGRKISEYLAMDLNNDGFLTVDEYYRWKRKTDELARKNGESAGDQFARGGAGNSGGSRGPGGGGGFPGMGGGGFPGGGGGFPGMGGGGFGGGGFPGMGGGGFGGMPGGGGFPGGGGGFPGMGGGGFGGGGMQAMGGGGPGGGRGNRGGGPGGGPGGGGPGGPGGGGMGRGNGGGDMMGGPGGGGPGGGGRGNRGGGGGDTGGFNGGGPGGGRGNRGGGPGGGAPGAGRVPGQAQGGGFDFNGSRNPGQ